MMFSIDQEWENSNNQDLLSMKLFGDAKEKLSQVKKKKKNIEKHKNEKFAKKDIKSSTEKVGDLPEQLLINSRKRKLAGNLPNCPNNVVTDNLESKNNKQKKKRKKNEIKKIPIEPEIKQKIHDIIEKSETENISKKNNTEIELIQDKELYATKDEKIKPDIPKNKKKKKKKKLLKISDGIGADSMKDDDKTENIETTKNVDKTGDSVDIKNFENSEIHSQCKNGHLLSKKLSKFQEKLNRKLEGGHFRWINETLYTSESKDAEKLFREQPELFDVYHKGFESQVKHWPENPVDLIISFLREKPSSLVVVDFGCGNAKLSQSIPNKVHSFDLVAVNEHVTACDMKRVPLPHSTVDVAVFSLALMGTNVTDFILEANRVLKEGGILKIAEVKSRFKDINEFVSNVSTLGFELLEKDEGNKMFVILDFQKSRYVKRSRKLVKIELKPCIYKKR